MHQVPQSDFCEYRICFDDRKNPLWLTPLLATALGASLGFLSAWAAFPQEQLALTAIGGLAGLALEGWRQVWAQARAAHDHSSQLLNLLQASDSRYDQLWSAQLGLRRALLTNRKIAGYLAPDVLEQLAQSPEGEIELGGVSTQAAVLFADLVGFTPRCEHVSPRRIVDELNLYFSHVDPVITLFGGVIDKRIGDGIMVVFAARDGATHQDELNRRAVQCALEMLRAMKPCNQALLEEKAAPMSIRVGLAAGPIVQGTMGSRAKLEYTVIGDVVNLASRLEGLATPGHVLMESSLLMAASGDFTRVRETEVKVKGREQLVHVVELAP